MIETALIPVAGVGTRLFPATRAVKKELLPVVGADGIARPALVEILLEALSVGVERFVLVIQPDDLNVFKVLFDNPLPRQHYTKLPEKLQQEADRLLEFGRRIEYAFQPQQDGFGHAVWCARDQIGSTPFLLMLGDHLYRSNQAKSCAAQLASVYEKLGGSVVALNTTQSNDLASRGVVGGTWQEPNRLLKISQFAEKPSPEYARQHLQIANFPSEQFLVLFGEYILQPAIFDYLDEIIRRDLRERGEYQITSALDMLRRNHGCFGLLVDGTTYDIGQPHLYVDTLQAYRLP